MKKRRVLFGVLAVVLVAVAVSVCLFAVTSAPQVTICTDQQGHLSLSVDLPPMDYTVVWETDGGRLTTLEENSPYTAPTENNYYLYARLDESVEWQPEDADGYRYETVTVKVSVYPCDGERPYWRNQQMPDTVYTAALTVTCRDGGVTPAEERLFGNPVRQGGDQNWQQIQPVYQHKNYVVLRYRCGYTLESERVLAWGCTGGPFRGATFGATPLYVPGEKQEPPVPGTNLVCFYFPDRWTEDYPANIEITAGIFGRENTPAKATITYYAGEDAHYEIACQEGYP
ncbi:MAG: hypothetical protein J6R77_07760 [Clostridia bacterium]|nr:hypothetical protein [Clostridia bacterium]